MTNSTTPAFNHTTQHYKQEREVRVLDLKLIEDPPLTPFLDLFPSSCLGPALSIRNREKTEGTTVTTLKHVLLLWGGIS